MVIVKTILLVLIVFGTVQAWRMARALKKVRKGLKELDADLRSREEYRRYRFNTWKDRGEKIPRSSFDEDPRPTLKHLRDDDPPGKGG